MAEETPLPWEADASSEDKPKPQMFSRQEQVEQPQWAKLAELTEFIVISEDGYTWQRWNEQKKRFERSDDWADGFEKTYTLMLDKNRKLSVSHAQICQMYGAVAKFGRADIIGKQFTVKTNAKEGKDRRYFINAGANKASH